MAAALTQINLSPFDSYKRQYFSLPFGIISYIISNPHSADGLLKIQKTCKYFFAKNQIVVVEEEVCQNKNGLYRRKNMEILPRGNYWFIQDLIISDYFSFNYFETFYRYNLRSLWLFFPSLVNISLSEINFLLNDGKLESLRLQNVNIRDDGAIVSVDQLLAKLPNITHFYHHNNDQVFTNQTFTNMNSLVFNSKFIQFHCTFCFLQEDVDFLLLCNFIKKNSTFNSEFFFEFACDRPQHFLETFETIAKIQFSYTTCQKMVNVQVYFDLSIACITTNARL